MRLIGLLEHYRGNLVKGRSMEGLGVVTSLREAVEAYGELGLSELHLHDCTATLFGRDVRSDWLEAILERLFLPVTISGGITTLEQADELIRRGADRVGINSAFVNSPEKVNEFVRGLGSSSIVAIVDAIFDWRSGEYRVTASAGREILATKPLNWALELEDRGAGEIFLRSVDNDGTGAGLRDDLIAELAERISVPLVVGGGFSSPSQAFGVAGKVEGIVIGAFLHSQVLLDEEAKVSSPSQTRARWVVPAALRQHQGSLGELFENVESESRQ